MKIIFLGTGSAVPSRDRDNTSLLFLQGENSLLADCPGSAYLKLMRAGLEPALLKSIFITHTHPDHLYGLPALIHSLCPAGKFPEVYVPEGIAEMTRALLGLFGLERKIEITECAGELPFLNTNLFKTRHNAESAGMVITEGQKKIVYTSDTGPLEDSSGIFRQADCLIHDCSAPERFKENFLGLDETHTSAETLGKMAQSAEVRMLVPVHFSGEFDFTTDEIEKSIRKNYSGKLFIPRDFDTLEI